MSSISPISPLSPVSPMSPAKSSARPPHLVLNQHSSSLSGMEIAVPSPLTPGFRTSRASSSKALPQTPRKASVPYSPHSAPTSRKASSTYSDPNEERPRTPRFALQDEALSSKTFLAPPEARSSTSKVPDRVPTRPLLTRDARTLGACDFAPQKQSSGNSIFTEWKAPKYEYSDDEYVSSLPSSRKASSQASWAPFEGSQSAEDRAREYTSVLPAFVPEPSHSESGFLPFEMSARIIDVFDGSVMPAALVLSGNSEDRKLSSQFSSSESDTDSLHDGSKPSLKSRAKKAFQPRKVSRERTESARADLKLPQQSQSRERASPERASPERDSLQSGIDGMYNTLTGLYSPSKPKVKRDSANPRSKAIDGDLGRPAAPVHRNSGKKAWDSPKTDDSVGKKLANVFQNGAMAVGFDRGRERKIKNDEWRTSMKKKIVLVHPQHPI